MKKVGLVVALLIFQFGCQTAQTSSKPAQEIDFPTQTVSADEISPEEKALSETPDGDTPYLGVTIDQKFPIVEAHDFREENLKGKAFAIRAENFEVSFVNFAPRAINKNNTAIFNFAARYPKDYHSSLVGTASLLGRKSKQIYVVTGGPGAACCTNYWITDVSGEKPRNIFRSEDFGSFRNAMEIFDADGDGIYELVQFDSAFRYFMDDCGSCSPEPRAVFKYDKKTGKYLPAKGTQQDFVKKGFIESEKWLAETSEKLRKEKDIGLEIDFHRSLIAHIVDLIYFGEENKAWQTFNKYFAGNSDKEKIRAEIKKRLSESKFYQALKSRN